MDGEIGPTDNERRHTVGVIGRDKSAEWRLVGSPIGILQIVARAVVIAEALNGALWLLHSRRAESLDGRLESVYERQSRVDDIGTQFISNI